MYCLCYVLLIFIIIDDESNAEGTIRLNYLNNLCDYKSHRIRDSKFQKGLVDSS